MTDPRGCRDLWMRCAINLIENQLLTTDNENIEFLWKSGNHIIPEHRQKLEMFDRRLQYVESTDLSFIIFQL